MKLIVEKLRFIRNLKKNNSFFVFSKVLNKLFVSAKTIFFSKNGTIIFRKDKKTIVFDRVSKLLTILCSAVKFDAILHSISPITNICWIAVLGFLKFRLSRNRLQQEGKQEAIPQTLPPPNLIFSLLPSLQLDVTRTIWRGLEVEKQETRSKKKIEQEKLEGKSLNIWDGARSHTPPCPQESSRKWCFD